MHAMNLKHCYYSTHSIALSGCHIAFETGYTKPVTYRRHYTWQYITICFSLLNCELSHWAGQYMLDWIIEHPMNLVICSDLQIFSDVPNRLTLAVCTVDTQMAKCKKYNLEKQSDGGRVQNFPNGSCLSSVTITWCF